MKLSSLPYKVSHMRGSNLIAANPERLQSKGGERWATGRNVKRSLPGRRYDAVEVWTLKYREGGKVVVFATHRSREDAVAWTSGGCA
jgi:hypothetical protein